jgi:hypothetical protein
MLRRGPRVATIIALTLVASAFTVPHRHSTASTSSAVSAAVSAAASDSVGGEWTAKGSDPGWNGRFVLHLILQQAGDSVYGTYQFDVDAAAVVPPTDVFGHIRNGRIELQDRADKFWLSATARGNRLNGRLAGGSHNRASAMSVSFTRVEGGR